MTFRLWRFLLLTSHVAPTALRSVQDCHRTGDVCEEGAEELSFYKLHGGYITIPEKNVPKI